MDLNLIDQPKLLLNEEICKRNMNVMQVKAANNNCKLRPHFKTHQSHQIGAWMREMGLDRIAVSSLRMAEYFAADGWQDILVAFPVNLREITGINALAQKVNLQLIVESKTVIGKLNQLLEAPLAVYIELDLDYGRSGVGMRNFEEMDSLIEALEGCENLDFAGFMGHAGQSYGCRSAVAIQSLHDELIQGVRALRARYQSQYPNLIISIGDTPTCAKAEGWDDVDEMRPGNYVFYDLMQWQIGACALKEIAVALAAPVVAKHASKQELILHSGGVHLSKDRIELNGSTCFGLLAKLTDKGWEQAQEENYLKSLSQEHGVAKTNQVFFDAIEVGDLVAILPVHSCMTANTMGGYLSLAGEELDHMQAHRF